MSKLLLKSLILLALLVSSIFTTYVVQQVNAVPTYVTVTSTNMDGMTTLSLSNSADSTSDVGSFIIQINTGSFKSFKLDNGWSGVKTSSTTLAFSAINPLKPGKSISFQIKTDQQTPNMIWKASDVNNIEIGSGEIGGTTSSGTTSSGTTSSGTTSSGTTSSGTTSSGTQTQQPVRGILDSSTFRIIPSTPAISAHVRVIGFGFSASSNLDLYLGNDKIGSFSSNGNGNLLETITIPDSEQAGSVNFILKDQQGNQKSFTTNLKSSQQRSGVVQSIPLTVNFDPILHRGETKLVSGTATPGSTLTFSIFDSKGNSITTLTAHPDKNGKYSFERTIPVDMAFGKYSVTLSDGKTQVSKQFSVTSTHAITVSTNTQRYEQGQTVILNGTSISNQIVNFVITDPTGHQIYSTAANVTSSGTVSTSYKLDDAAIEGTYTITTTQGNDVSTQYFGVGIDPAPPITANLDKLSYSSSESPVVRVTGPPSSTFNLIIIDPSSKQKFADIVNLGPDGQAMYSFNLTAYTPGVYSLVVDHADQKVQKDFAVGLAIGSGKIVINTVKDSYLPGDNIIIIGTTNPNTLLQMTLTDPHSTTVKSTQIFSDKTGHFSSFVFSIPPVATPGIWKIDATSGVNHVSSDILVKSTSQGITIHVDKDSDSYAKGDIIVISGTDAGTTTPVTIKIENNDTVVDTLPTTSTNRGEYSTSWQIPRNIDSGTYTIQASSTTGIAVISIKIQ